MLLFPESGEPKTEVEKIVRIRSSDSDLWTHEILLTLETTDFLSLIDKFRLRRFRRLFNDDAESVFEPAFESMTVCSVFIADFSFQVL